MSHSFTQTETCQRMSVFELSCCIKDSKEKGVYEGRREGGGEKETMTENKRGTEGKAENERKCFCSWSPRGH